MKYYLKIVAVACLALLTAQCEVIDSDLLNDPNNPSPANLDPNFLLNNIQFEARNVYAGAASDGAEMSRMRYMFGDTYANAYTSQSFNGVYQNTYADLFIDVENLLPIADERNLYFHAGMAKVLKAYAMLTMVDIFGDVPYSQALDPSNFNPGTDPGSEVYAAALTLLDEAIADLQNEDRLAFPDTDLYYGGASDQVAAWVRAANTLKLKAYLNTGNASAFSALVNDGNIISSPGQNFTFQFGTEPTNPDSRHPSYSNNYVDAANDYMAVNYLNFLLNDKPDTDPRIFYYFYRQTLTDPEDVNLNTCIAANTPAHFEASDPFCLLGQGWWGRDHLIDDGIPPDTDLRTTFGVYPVGGRFDANNGDATDDDMGYQGAGFDPILMSSFTHFMIAEAQIRFDIGVDARTALETAVTQSLQTVRAFGDAAVPRDEDGVPNANIMTDTELQDYVAEVMDRWDNNPAEQLAINSKEYYLALWPNGLEAYNLLRRTGWGDASSPDKMQPARAPNPGTWYSTFSYPANMVERNSSISPKPDGNAARTFWDDGGYDFNY